MEIKDDRNEEQQVTLSVLIGGRDKFMSGWGGAEGGTSYAYWACTPDDADSVEQWVRSRGEIVTSRRHPPSGNKEDHCHIYCVTQSHSALQTKAQPAP